MDTIKFAVNSEEQTVDIFINDHNLIDIVRQIELPYAEQEGIRNVAGNYMGLHLDHVFPPAAYFWGDRLYGDSITLLRCGGCGYESCWSLETNIVVQDGVVMWRDFVQPQRNGKNGGSKWDYHDLQFMFDKIQYEQELLKYKVALKSTKRITAFIFEDEKLGWVIKIPYAFEYFDPLNTITVKLGEKEVDFEVIDVERQFWWLAPDPEGNGFEAEQFDDSWVRLLYLPKNSTLLYDWLNGFLDVKQFLTERKSKPIFDPHQNPSIKKVRGICHHLTLYATITPLQPPKLYELHLKGNY